MKLDVAIEDRPALRLAKVPHVGPYADIGAAFERLHVGPYEQLPALWQQLFVEWLPGSGQRLRPTASFEIYRNTPEEVPPGELRTDLYVPIE
jgi:DNA gyrase inhibitor GyrI